MSDAITSALDTAASVASGGVDEKMIKKPLMKCKFIMKTNPKKMMRAETILTKIRLLKTARKTIMRPILN